MRRSWCSTARIMLATPSFCRRSSSARRKGLSRERMQIGLAVEEVFVNIAQYAYGNGSGKAKVRVEVDREPIAVKITFIDHGMPYDPLAHKDPDITLSAEDREVGGLGIFLTKKSMDDVNYEYRNGQNILTLKKNL